MTSVNDLHAWLNTAAGHCYQAEAGGYSKALNALIAQDQDQRAAAYALNTERQRNGLDPLPASTALAAVRPRGGPQVTGTDQFRDPGWRVKVGADDTEHDPVHWDPRSLAIINYVRAASGQDAL